MNSQQIEVVTVTPNPAIDLTLTIPSFSAGSVNRVAHRHSKPGGKGVNVAAALADYGRAVAVTGFLGRENASAFEALCASKGISDYFIRIAGETRVGIKISDPARQETTDINFPGQTPAPAEVDALTERLRGLAADSGRWFVLSGSLPPGVEATMYGDFTRLLKNAGSRVLLDTSGDALTHALAAAPHIIKPNVHELEALLGERLETRARIIEAARKILAGGIELVVVSMGEAGALFVTGERAVQAHPPQVNVRSTVGAGDAMVAGILAGLLEGLDLAQTARLATAFSLDAITRAESAQTSHEQIEALMPEILID